MKFLSIAAGGLLLAGGLYVLVGEHLAGTSTDATINARVITLRAPIEGTANFTVRELGTRADAQQPIAQIFDTRYDNYRILDFERSRSSLKTDLDRVIAQYQAVEQARALVQEQSSRYQQGRIRQIEARQAEAKAALDATQARLREAENALKRTTDLNTRGLQTTITLERAQANFEVAQLDVESANQRIAFLQTELVSARSGVFLGDSYNDTPSSSQRIRELDLRMAELKAERQQIEQRYAIADRQVAAERLRMNTLTSAVVAAQTSALLWDMLSGTGEYVRRGDDLARMVDCSGLVVTATVSESMFNKLAPGASAQLRLYGDSRVFDATVTRLGGSGARSLYDNLAIGPSAEQLRRFHVTLSVPTLTDHPDLNCAVGRTGKVVFTSGAGAALGNVVMRLGL